MNIQLQEIKNIFIKNRLTEGVDFVRKEWLKGDNTATIEWYANLWINQLHTVIGKDKKIFIYSKDWSNNTKNLVLRQEGTQLTVIFRSGTDNWSHIADYAQFASMPDVVDFKFYIDNNNANCERNGELFVGRYMQSYWNDNAGFYIYGGKMKLLEEYDSTNDKLISSLVPCQLLKSIPVTLDANNIARQAGECGMYDSISGKFYGNVSSTGTFTVEGEVEPETHTGLQQIYQNKLIEGVDYETYDWLKADIPPISTSMMTLPINSKNFEFKRNFIQLMNSGYFETSSSDRFSYYITDFGTRNDLKPRIWDSDSLSDAYISPNVLGLGLHTIIANDNGVTISSVTNTASLPWYGSPEKICLYNTSNINKNTIYLTSSIKVDGVTRYVPCTLLRSIPRNLDAQCKERVAGECGMVDLISGKFYGNVANSGTFTVENDNNE